MKKIVLGMVILGSFSVLAVEGDYEVKAGVICAKDIYSLNRKIHKKTKVGNVFSNRALSQYGSVGTGTIIAFNPKVESKVEISSPTKIDDRVCVSVSMN